TRDTLTLKEGDAAPVSAPYAAKELGKIILFTHMIPDTVRGYNIVIDKKTNLVTAFEVWFCGFEPDKREVWRHYMFGYVDTGGPAPEERHGYTNRIEGLGTYWKDDNGTEMLYFFPSLIWSSFVELSNPRGRITITAPSDYIKINDKLYIYSRVEQEYSGTFTLEVIELFNVRHIGVRLGFDLQDKLDYRVYEGKGKVTGWSTNLEPLTYHGTKMPDDETLKQQINPEVKGSRPHYRPRFLYPDYTQEQVDEIIKTNSKIFEGRNIMTSSNTMETSDYLVGKRFTLRFDDGPAWEYEILDTSTLKWREEGKTEWQEEIYQAFEPAPDIIVYSHICTGSKPLRCLTQAVDFSKALATCVDAQMGNGRKPWEVGRTVHFGVLETEGGPVPPAVERHGFTTDLVGKAFAWIYGDFMQSIHVYSTPESYSWTIILPGNAGGWMWSSHCFYIKLRDDAYLMSWVEDACNGMQGLFVLNPNLMHDAGFGFGMSNFEGEDALSVTTVGAYARPLAGFDILKYFENKRK
ncbi:MAG: MoaF N-terminal domain-containing protein, partial [Bacillota bacterium]|nr:MoaF N-terminal domain-containing protein [Bacillota bacterium]